MRILVTGAAGLIGRHLTAELVARGHVVHGLDIAAPEQAAWGLNGSCLSQGDARDPVLLADLAWCDHMIAGAARCGPAHWLADRPHEILQDNLVLAAATARAAIVARADGSPLARVTWISSSMVYESATVWPHREGDQDMIPPPRTAYGLSKLVTERYARAAWEQHGLPYTIIRPFNVIVPGEPPGRSHVLTDLARKVMSGQDPLEIMGDGKQVRCLTWVGDIARGICDAVESSAAINEDFNLAGTTPSTVLDLAGAVWSRAHGDEPLRWVSAPAPALDVRARIPDASKALRLLGWQATATLDVMVDAVLDSVKAEMACA